MSLRVQFIHGLESSPQSAKARFFAQHFEALTPEMDTSDFEGSVSTQAAALQTFRPDVVVGSSFGGAVALALLSRGFWKGPTLLLAQAGAHFGQASTLPPDVPVLVVHGTRDDVVSIEGSRHLVRNADPAWVELLEVDDGHRLQSLVDDGTLAELVRRVAARRAER